jgi:hypothetical protein
VFGRRKKSNVQRKLFLALSDLHCGSSLGLLPPGGVSHPDGIEIRPHPDSKLHPWFWSIYQRLINLAGERYDLYGGDVELHCVLVGDLTDGNHHGTTQLLSPSEEVHVQAAVRTLQEGVLTLPLTSLRLVGGTPAHVGKEGGLEKAVGYELERLNAPLIRQPHDNSPVWEVLEGECLGTWTDWRHHGRSGQRPWTRHSYAAQYAEAIHRNAQDEGRPVPGLSVRAHVHKSYFVAPAPSGRGALVGLPCFQYGTAYIRRKAIESLPDVGGAIIEVDETGHVDCRLVVEHPTTANVRPENVTSF